LASGRPAPETFAELSGAAICVALGAVAGGRIPRGSGRTADWRMVWPGDAGLDLEVTAAKRKKKHVERQTFATDLAKDAAADAAKAKALWQKLYDDDVPTALGPGKAGMAMLLTFAKDADKVGLVLLAQRESLHAGLASELENADVKALVQAAGKAAKANYDKLAAWYESWYDAELPSFGPFGFGRG